MHTRHPAVPAVFALLFVFACAKSPDAPPTHGEALNVVAGAGLSDTIQATPSPGLVVEVRGPTGQPESGLTVIFEACPVSDDYYTCSPTLLAPTLDVPFAQTASTTTDENGRTVVRMRMGTLAGPASVRITAPLYSLGVSAAFTVLPGAAVAVRAVLGDTTVDLGGSFTARAGVVDRAGNLRSDPVTFEATSPALQVSGTGSVSGVAIGRAYVRVRGTVGGITGTDSLGITVVPKARLVYMSAWGQPAPPAPGGYAELYLESLAGGAARVVGAGVVSSPAWSPTGDRIAYFEFTSGDPLLLIGDTVGAASAAWTPGVTWPNGPEYSRDGRWIYFYGYSVNGKQVFRVHPDATGLEALQGPTEDGGYPSPSPDGTRFAYTTDRNLLVKTLATGHVDTLVIATSFVSHTRWSPDGNWIAYIEDYSRAIGLVRPDGSGQRHIAASVDHGLTWSPDSKWLLGVDSSRLVLVDVTPGTIYPLTTPGYEPAWHP
jgi:hypothetical protein